MAYESDHEAPEPEQIKINSPAPRNCLLRVSFSICERLRPLKKKNKIKNNEVHPTKGNLSLQSLGSAIVVVGGGVIGTPTRSFCLRFVLGRGLSDSVEVGGRTKIHWSGLLVRCQSTSTRVWLGFGGMWGVAKQAVWSLTVGVGRQRVEVKQHSGWVGGCPGGLGRVVVHSQPERHGQSQLLFAHLHCQTYSPVLVLCHQYFCCFFSLKTTFLFHPKGEKKITKT